MSLAGHRDLDRRPGRFVGRDGRERHAPAHGALRRPSPCRGDVRGIVLPACLAVGRPIVFSVAIMVLSFLPVFALAGSRERCSTPWPIPRPSPWSSVAVLAITLVPALCTLFIRGRLRSERENPLVRGVIEVYRPVLSYLMDRPAALAWRSRRDVPSGIRSAGQPARFPRYTLPGDRCHGALRREPLECCGRHRPSWCWSPWSPSQMMHAPGARVHDAAR